MESEKSSKWRGYVSQIILVIISLILGGVLTKYVFKDKPELTFQIFEGDPINTDIGKYYSTNLIIQNVGDIPLGKVRVFLKYDGKIVKTSSNLYGDNNLDDSVNVRREFRMPLNTHADFKITSKGKMVESYIASEEVVAHKIDSSAGDKRLIENLKGGITMLAIVLAIFFGAYYATNKELKAVRAEKNNIVKELEDFKRIT